MSRLWFKLAAAAVFILAWTQSLRLEPRRETGILPLDPATPYIHYLPAGRPRARVLVVHGLDASKETMQILSAALADGGFEVYSIDLPGHGDSPARFEAQLAERAIQNVLGTIGADSIVVGHSLGAGLLLDLAGERSFSTMVLLSPPPTPVAEVRADRVLLVSGEFDIPRIRAFAPILADTGSHVEWWQLTWAAHSSAIFNPVHVRRIVEWLGGNGEAVRTVARLIWIGVMFVAAIALGIGLMPGRRLEALPVSIPATMVRYVLACGAAVLVLRIVMPMRWLRLFATDYLVSFLLLIGLVLWIQRRESLHVSPTAMFKAIGAAAFAIVILGLLTGSHALHIALSNGRWWRFPFIAAAGFPLFAFDELAIRCIHPRWKSAAMALITRALLWAFLMLGVLLLNREDAFLVLIAHLMVFFWIALWFAAGIVHRHTQSPFAAALFAALVQGWAFAAWFVTT